LEKYHESFYLVIVVDFIGKLIAAFNKNKGKNKDK